ncbi:unnamed protein product [Miscanthus lutarioriparius]|uniref:Protein kinase domain-containing protein n=1 Tax=Miscanthus lutarioriparius TaxID=422564 RepID=A0A811NNK6_9POAL|nr:unnamed protein product [Miscanthus lutarioriparius]
MTTIEEMLAEILAKLEEMNAHWHSPAGQSPSPSSPPSTSIFTADAGSSSPCSASSPSSASPRSARMAASEYSLLAISDSETEAEPAATSLIPSPTSAPPQDTDHDFHHTAMVARYCCLFGFHIQSFRSLPWPPWVFARVFRTWVLLVSSLSLLRPPDTSSSSNKSCMDSCCLLTFDPGIMLLSTSVVISMRLLDSRKDILSGPCALLLKASASSATTFDQDANLDIPVALPAQHVMCLLSALSLCDNNQKYMIADQTMAAFLPEKEQSRGILALPKSREEFFTNVELDMLSTSKCLMQHYVRYFWSKHQISFLDLTPYMVWASLLNLASTPSENTVLSLVQLLGVMPNYILNLAGDCFACMRAMGCTEAVYALKKVYSIYTSCESSTPSVLVIQASISIIPIAAAPHLYMQHTVCWLSALNLSDTSQQLMITLAISLQSTTACSAFHYFSIRPVLSVGMDKLCFCTSICAAHEMFEMGKTWIMAKLAMKRESEYTWCSLLQPTKYLTASNSVVLESPWDPGASELIEDVTATAWGQAVFQGRGNAIYLAIVTPKKRMSVNIEVGFYEDSHQDALHLPIPNTSSLLIAADQMIARVEHMHTRVFLHRDIKPDNFYCGWFIAQLAMKNDDEILTIP